MAQPSDGDKRLRIGDAERTAAADELGEHYAQGRLNAEEHHERLDQVWAAKTRAELAPVFADLPGSGYRAPSAYATADRPGVGSDRPRGNRPFPAVPFGRPPFGRPPYVGPRGGRLARGWRGLPGPVAVLLVLLVGAFVLTHLPIILIALVVWFVLFHKLGHRSRTWHHYQR